jgi:hypothetical protein
MRMVNSIHTMHLPIAARGLRAADGREDPFMRIEIRQAETSTTERPLWVWRVWCNGRLAQGFSPTEVEANSQAKLEQARLGHCWGAASRFIR